MYTAPNIFTETYNWLTDTWTVYYVKVHPNQFGSKLLLIVQTQAKNSSKKFFMRHHENISWLTNLKNILIAAFKIIYISYFYLSLEFTYTLDNGFDTWLSWSVYTLISIYNAHGRSHLDLYPKLESIQKKLFKYALRALHIFL